MDKEEEKKEAGYQEEVKRAGAASNLMSDPLLIEAFDSIEKQIKTAWDSQEQYCPEFSQNAWRTLSCLKKVKEYLENIVTGGEFAVHELARLSDQEETPQ